LQGALKKRQTLGSSDRKFVAETIYEIVRWKRLYGKIAEVKDPFIETIFGECSQFGPYLEDTYSLIGVIEGTPERK
jgi:16S rRNA (cytosine967-C5)-methyltransferase